MTVPIASMQSIAPRLARTQLALRLVIVLAGLAAVVSIRLAAAEAEPVLDLVIVVLVLVAALFPDGHAGILVVVAVGVNWVLAVDDPTTQWVMVGAVAVAVFHSALALATVAPLGARLERATLWRWARRTALVVSSVPPVWLCVVLADRLDIGTSQLLVGVALLVVAAWTMWSRRGGPV